MIPHLTWKSEFLMAGGNGIVQFPQCALFFCAKNEMQNIKLMPLFANLNFTVNDFATGLPQKNRIPNDVKYVWFYNGDFYRPVLTIMTGDKVLACIKEGPDQKVWFTVWGVPETMWKLVSKFLEMYVDPEHNLAYPASKSDIQTGHIGHTIHAVRPADHINLFLKIVGDT